MRPASFLLLMVLLHRSTCLPQQNIIHRGFKFMLPESVRKPSALNSNGKTIESKLSPVPPESEAGLPSPPVPEPLEIEYEVHEAPAAPHNYILQPLIHGTRPGGAHPSPSHEKPLVYGTNGHYYINQQGHLVQKPQRPQYGSGQVSGRPPPLNFNESPPVFPHLTDEELYMLGQPAPVHLAHQGNGTRPPEVMEEEKISVPTSSDSGSMETQSNATNGLTASIQSQTTLSQITASSSSMLPQLLQTASNQPPNPPMQYQPSPSTQPLLCPTQNPVPPNPPIIPQNPSLVLNMQSPATSNQLSTPKPPTKPSFQYPSATSQPSMTQNGPAGVYIATVSYGPSEQSLVYTCIPTEQFKPGQGGYYVQGPYGYSCKMSQGRPLLASQILTANNQKPVTQPVLSSEPLSLPIVTPIKFDNVILRYV